MGSSNSGNRVELVLIVIAITTFHNWDVKLLFKHGVIVRILTGDPFLKVLIITIVTYLL